MLVYILESNATFSGKISLFLLLNYCLQAFFIQNRAYSRVGAIYVKDSQCLFVSTHFDFILCISWCNYHCYHFYPSINGFGWNTKRSTLLCKHHPGNYQAYFPRVTARVKFFDIFILWLNLDLGIETCFYNDIDIYAYSWLQFLFSFYLLLLVGSIVLACRYSRSIAKSLGQNPVAVLASLLLMSFSKLLQASIVPLSWIYLIYYTGSFLNKTHRVVWLYDASIQYFKEPKHTALGLFAISSLIVFVSPYILLIATDQPLASRLLQLVDSFMVEQDQAIHGCLSCSIQEAHSLLDWATVDFTTGTITYIYY